MLYKNILKELPPTQLDKMKMGKRSYLAVSRIEKTKKCGRILVVDIYQREKPQDLLYRFFSDKNTYQIYDVKKDKWERKSLYGVITGEANYYYYIEEKYKIAASDEAVETVKKFLGSKVHYWSYESEIIGCIDQYVRNLAREQRERSEEKREARKEKYMNMFPTLPKDFNDFLQNSVFNKYIFTDKKVNGIKPGRCTACGKKINVSPQTKHKSVIKCPKCGNVVVVFEKRYIDSIHEKKKVFKADKVDGQFLFRWMNVTAEWYVDKQGKYKARYYEDDYFRELHLSEKGTDKTIRYEFKSVYPYGYAWREYKWTDERDDLSYVYSNNLTEIFGEKYYNVSLQKELSKNQQPLHFVRLLKNLKELPPTEYLFKMGMYRLASELDSHRLKKGNDFGTILGINPQYKKMYAEKNVSKDEHIIIKTAREWVSEDDLMKLRNLRSQTQHVGTICHLLGTMTFRKFVNYFNSQKKICPRVALDQLFRWYEDYVSMSEQMNIDLSHKSVRYPKDIKAAHDNLLAKYKAIEDKALEEQMRKAAESLYNGLTEYKDNDYAIVFPRTRAEFIAEGQSLNHCVGTQEKYFKNHIAGTNMIFFIRHADDIKKPYVTMEIDMKRLVIIQIYGYGDKRPNSETVAFANKFLTRLKKDTMARRAS